jgi:Flp pilus assembly protein TadB
MAMTPEVSAAVLAGSLATGVVLLLAGLRGTTAPPAPPPAALARLRRWWRGGDTGERRAWQTAAIGAVVAGVAALVVTGIPAAALLAAAAVPALPWLWHAGRGEQRAVARAEAVGMWAGRLKDQLATGSGLVAAIAGSAGSAPPAIAPQVRAMASRIRGGMPPPRALHLFADEVDDTVAEQVVAALLLHLEDRGEHLPDVLAALSEDASRVVSTRREVHAKRAQARMTVRFMIVLTSVVTAALAYLGLLSVYRVGSGQLVLLTLAAAFAAVLAWVHAMSSPPAPHRFLAPSAGGRGWT